MRAGACAIGYGATKGVQREQVGLGARSRDANLPPTVGVRAGRPGLAMRGSLRPNGAQVKGASGKVPSWIMGRGRSRG